MKKSDAEILDEINTEATIHKNNSNQQKFRDQAVMMEEKTRHIASDSLEMNITTAKVDLSDPETGILFIFFSNLENAQASKRFLP